MYVNPELKTRISQHKLSARQTAVRKVPISFVISGSVSDQTYWSRVCLINGALLSYAENLFTYKSTVPIL